MRETGKKLNIPVIDLNAKSVEYFNQIGPIALWSQGRLREKPTAEAMPMEILLTIPTAPIIKKD